MNRYNVRAVRKELDSCIRNCSWRRFRARFAGLSDALKRAVILETRSKKAKARKFMSKHAHHTLLHSLCHCVQAQPPVPIDLIESVAQACPEVLTSSSPTPLSIALDRQASPAVIECLLMSDQPNRPSLYVLNGQGETPILQAVKQQASEHVIQLLVEYDSTRASLLIPSKKRHRVPLFYVANEELFRNNFHNAEEPLPDELEYMLLQTYYGIEIAAMRRDAMPQLPDSSLEEDDASRAENEDSYDDESDVGDESTNATPESLTVLRATIACSHFLGDKNTTKLFQILHPKVTQYFESVDGQGDTLLHHICRAEQLFLAPIVEQADGGEPINLLQYVMEAHPVALQSFNNSGELPLHVALEHQKPWDMIQRLLAAAPETVRMPNQGGSFPLHISLGHYPILAPVSSEENDSTDVIFELWKLYPDATAFLDEKERLYAFQLAAIPTRNKCSQNLVAGGCPTKTKDPLSAIFFLLRSSPDVLRGLC